MPQSFPSLIRNVAGAAVITCMAFLVLSGCDQNNRKQPVSMTPSEPTREASVKDSKKETPPAAKPDEARVLDSDAEAVEAIHAAGGEAKAGKDGLITEVTFRDSPMTDKIAELVASLKKVTKLSIYSSEMSSAGWKSLGKLQTAQHFDVRNCKVSSSQLIAAASGMTRLRSLRLNGQNGDTTVDDEGLTFLDNCRELKVLAIDHLWVSADSLTRLPNPDAMLELYAAKTLLDDEALAMIGSWKGLKKLRAADTSVSNAGLAELESLKLEELDLSECQQFNDEAMASVGKLTTLKRLNLWRTSLTDAGVSKIAPLVNLTWLNLDNIPLSDEGLKALANMQKLQFLHLGSTQVTDVGMKQLVDLKSLNDLRVTRTAVTEEGVQPVKAAHPGMSIQIKYIEGQ